MRARYALFGVLLALAGCASVHFENDASSLKGEALVFGKIILVRDGDAGVINVFGTSVTLQNSDSDSEPLLINERFASDGRFYWQVAPGRYLLNITLNQSRGEVASLAFTVPAPAKAYYFGNLVISGKKQFSALGAANIKEASLRFEDGFDVEKAELLTRDHQFTPNVERLAVHDISDVEKRWEYFSRELDDVPLCCDSMCALHFRELIFDSPSVIDIGNKNGTFAFASVKSHYAAFSLPPHGTAYTVAVRSLAGPSGIPGRYRVFVPAAVLLDENFAIAGTAESGFMKPAAASLIPPRKASLIGEIVITPGQTRAKYLVLYTTRSLLENPQITSVPEVIVGPGTVLPSGMSQPVTLEPWISGKVELTLRPHSGAK